MRGSKLLITFGLFASLALYATALPFENISQLNETTTVDPATDDTTTDAPITKESTTPENTTTINDIGTTQPQPVLCDSGVHFLPAPNCREYYHCLHGFGLLRVCPHDLYWDPVLNVCGWDSQYCPPEDNEEPNNPALDCSSNDVDFLPYQPDCTKFIQCVYGDPIKQHCPPGLLWNQPLQRCDYVCDYTI